MESISISVADVAASVTVLLISWGIRSVSSGRKEIVQSVDRLGEKVAETNGRVIKLETEIEGHIKYDDQRFEKQDRSNEKMWEHIERRKA